MSIKGGVNVRLVNHLGCCRASGASTHRHMGAKAHQTAGQADEKNGGVIMREVIGSHHMENGETAVYIHDKRTEQVDVVITRPARERWFVSSRTYEKYIRHLGRVQAQ